MKSITLDTTTNKFVISIDKNLIGKDTLIEILDNLRSEFAARKINFDQEIELLGEELKENWWRENKSRFIPANEQ